jgi:subtilase family serine protease
MTGRSTFSAIGALLAGVMAAVVVAGTSVAASGPTAVAPVFTAAAPLHVPVSVSRLFKPDVASAAPRGMSRLVPAPRLPVSARAPTAIPAGTPMHVTIALQPRDPVALSNFATEVSTPGAAEFRHYLTVREFAGRFGATAAAITAVRHAMRADGLKLAATTANGLSFRAAGTAGQLERAFATKLEDYRLSTGRIAFANTSGLAVPAKLAGVIQNIVGLNDLVLPQAQLMQRPGWARGKAATRPLSLLEAQTTSPPVGAATPCSAATAEAQAETVEVEPTPGAGEPGVGSGSGLSYFTAYTYDQLAQAYNSDPLYAAGDLGQGVTVGLYELESNFPSDIAAFDKCYGLTTNVSYVEIDGSNGAPDASDEDGLETSLDMETVAAMAPDASEIVYQGNDDSSSDAWLDTFTAIISQDKTQVVSISWGSCELLNELDDDTDDVTENTLFQEAATQGQSVFASAGDSGVDGCRLEADALPTVSVADPASQPFVTAVGGTTLLSIGDPPATAPDEDVWNNGEALDDADQGGAGGGGISTSWPMPAYQANAPASLNVVSTGLGGTGTLGASSGTPCSATSGYCRQVPDVTANADPYTGYVVYYDGSWTVIGGTSGSSPLWAGLMALADSDPACKGTPVGFANPTLYDLAGGPDYAKDFNDITVGDNDAYGNNGSEYQAGTGYSMASGVGSPIAASLIPAVCAAVPPAANTGPGTGTGTTGTGTGTSTTGTGTGPTTTGTGPASGDSGPTTTGTGPASGDSGPTTTGTGPASGDSGPTTTGISSSSGESSSGDGTTTSPGTTTTGATALVCTPPAKLTIPQHPAGRLRETKAAVYVDGKLVRRYKARDIRTIVLTRPTASAFTLRIVIALSNGAVVSDTVEYRGCRQAHNVWRLVHKA